jgi:NADPH:quinone reductase-like Zn-dependent oxidoreductase
MRAVQLTAFGNPVDGLEYVDIPEPDAPGPNQVLIGVEFSPINPSDLMLARGVSGPHGYSDYPTIRHAAT